MAHESKLPKEIRDMMAEKGIILEENIYAKIFAEIDPNKIKKWLDNILNEDGHKLSTGSLRTIQMIKDELDHRASANNIIRPYNRFPQAFHCRLCNTTFSDEHDLEVHIIRQHSQYPSSNG